MSDELLPAVWLHENCDDVERGPHCEYCAEHHDPAFCPEYYANHQYDDVDFGDPFGTTYGPE